jgi:hypothetical protein
LPKIDAVLVGNLLNIAGSRSIAEQVNKLGCFNAPVDSYVATYEAGCAIAERQSIAKSVILTAARDPRLAGSGYAETSQQLVDEAKVHQPQAVALRYTAMANASFDLLKRCELRD